MKRVPVLVLLVLIAVVVGCRYADRSAAYAVPSAPAPAEVVTPATLHSTAAPAATAAADKPVLYDNLGKWRRVISTSSPEAQKAFDQALTLAFAFNHDEAIRLYGEAAKHDPKSAMPHWGIAFANGPHINNPAMPPERSRAAWRRSRRRAVSRRRRRRSSATSSRLSGSATRRTRRPSAGRWTRRSPRRCARAGAPIRTIPTSGYSARRL